MNVPDSMVRLSLVLLVLLLPAGATAAPVLRVALPEGLDCPASEELLKSLSQRFGADRVATGQPSGNELGLTLTRLSDALELDLVSKPSEAAYRRRLPTGEGSCADLAETIGLVVDAWLRDLPWHGVGFLRDAPERVRPEPTEDRTANVVRRESAPQTAPNIKPTDAGPTRRHPTLTLRLGGGASLGGDTSGFGPEAALAADVALFRGLGVAVFATILENASARDGLSSNPAGSISVRRQVLAIAARYAFSADDGPSVFGGLALQALESRSSGYTFDPSNFELAPAGFASALWQQRIWQRVSAYAQLAATLGPRVDFDVSQAGVPRTILSLSPVRFDASIGVAVSFR